MNILHSLYKIAYRTAYKIKNRKAVRVEKKVYKDYMALLIGNKKYKNAHRGERCFVLGNGPSLGKVDLERLANETVFTVNFSMKLDSFGKARSNYHIWTDTQDFYNPEISDSIAEDIASLCNTEPGVLPPTCFFSIRSKEFMDRYNLSEKLEINYISHCMYFFKNCDDEFDFTKPSFDYNSVVFTGIALAIYMGFDEIYLLGCDATGIVGVINTHLEKPDTTHAYATDSTNEFLHRIAKETIPISNQFYNWYRILQLYSDFNTYCERRGVKLINCTAETVIDTIERRSLDEVLED